MVKYIKKTIYTLTKRFLTFFIYIACCQLSYAQIAVVKGRVLDSKTRKPLSDVQVSLEQDNVTMVSTDSAGRFEISVTHLGSERIIFQKLSYHPVEKKLALKADETRNISVEMTAIATQIRETVIHAKKKEKQVQTQEIAQEIQIDPLQSNPSGNIENTLKFQGLGVGGNSELGSQFSVRGGSFEENLIYVNDFEVYRPLLIRNAQQEGLSFGNSQLVQNMKFSSGGFSAEYGDKLSSVLDITYKKPKKWAGSIEAGLLGFSGHIEGVMLDKKLSFLSGIRYRNNGYLLGSQETKGSYLPIFMDWQNNIHYQATDKLSFEILSNIASNSFQLIPENRETNFGLVNLALTYRVNYSGQERDRYFNYTQGAAITYKINENFRIKYANTYYAIQERQYFDITGQYAIGEIESDVSSANYGNFKNVFGSGIFQNWGREKYDATMMHHHLSTNILLGKNNIKAGLKYKTESFDIYLNSWDRLDSAGYNIPSYANQIQLLNPIRKNYILNGQRYEFYLQDAIQFNLSGSKFIQLLFGVRGQYWSVNKEFFVSPRVQAFYSPRKNLSFYASVGSYNQPPFIRDLINEQGILNPKLKSQKSLHYILGTDVIFDFYKSPFKFTAEAYYKHLWDVNPYQYNNVLVRYSAQNNTIAYARGIDLRLQGELVEGAESWINIGIMDTKEFDGASFIKYRDSLGNEVYSPNLAQGKIVDTFLESRGWIQRPNNQFLTLNFFLQDYIPKMPNFRVNINMVIASGLPFGVPNNEPYRNYFNLLSYKRLDLGFSAKFYDINKRKNLPKSALGKMFKSIWATVDIFNVVGFNNQVSMNWIQDYSGNQFAVPNYLTGRRVNARVLFNF